MPGLKISDFQYQLPQERIALYPLPERDQSKLLHYNKGAISHHQFFSLANLLPGDSFLFFNDTKVIPARIYFTKDTGAAIEIFLLNPVAPSPLLSEAMLSVKECTWKCTVGNLKRWTNETLLTRNTSQFTVTAKLIDREEGLVKFSWDNNLSFAEVVTEIGKVPLPPYLKRETEKEDIERYQTIYSQHEGAVAAPTAGLHFTKSVFDSLQKRNIQHDFLTLHVSAGTFQPVKVENVEEHTMHHEQIIITKNNIENLLRNKFIIPVGTTSMRTLESLYWFGVRLIRNSIDNFQIRQEEPYEVETLYTRTQALEAVLNYMQAKNVHALHGSTSIYIRPGYKFRVCDGLITNFHQPGSTLMLLVAALIGDDWKKVYTEALANGYRFLSYGDSSLLIP